MYTLITVIIILISILIMLVILVQNPKGGGLGSTFGGMSSNTLGGARNAGDFLEKTTWGLIIALLFFSLFSTFFVANDTGNARSNSQLEEKILDYDANNFNPGGE